MASPWPPHNVPATSLTLKQGHVGDGALAFQPQESLQTTGPLESLNDCGRNQQGPPSGRGQAAHWEPITACAFTTRTGSQSAPAAFSCQALGQREQKPLDSSPREKTGVTLSIYVEPNERINGTLQCSIPLVAACSLLGKKAGCPRSVLSPCTRPSAERRRAGLRGAGCLASSR